MGTRKQEVKLQWNIGDQVLQDGRLHTTERERCDYFCLGQALQIEFKNDTVVNCLFYQNYKIAQRTTFQL